MLIENTSFNLGVNTILQPDFLNKDRQRDIKLIPALISLGGTKWVTKMIIDKSRKCTYENVHTRFTAKT